MRRRGLYVSNRHVRIEVKGQRPARPHSVATTDMDISGVTSPTHVLTSPFHSRPQTPPFTWGSTPSSPGGGGGEGGSLDGFDSLSPRTTHPPGHSRLPSTDSGIQADAGWDSLTRSYAKTFSKSGMNMPTVSTASKVRTINVEVLGQSSPKEGGKREGHTKQAEPRMSVSGGRVTSPTSLGPRASPVHTPRHSRPGESRRAVMSPERSSTDRVMSSSFTSFSSARVMSPERKAGPLHLLSSSTPVIPSRSAHDASGSPHSGDWVVGGRDNFPPHSRAMLAQAELGSASGRESRGPLYSGDGGRPGYSHRGQQPRDASPPRLGQHTSFFDPSPRHTHSHSQGSIVSQHYRPRVNPIPTRFVTPRVQVSSGLRPGASPDINPGRTVSLIRPPTPVPVSHGFRGPVSQGFKELSPQAPRVSASAGVVTSSSAGVRGITSVTSSVSRSKMSPTLLRDSLRGKISMSAPPTGVVHNIPIKHVDTCSACLKSTTSAGPERPTFTSGLQAAGPARSATSTGGKAVTPTVTSDVCPSDGSHDGVQASTEGSAGLGKGGERKVPILDLCKEVPWKERRLRIDSALSWLKNELESLRAMDTALVTQFRRCQDTIESLKQQRDAAWDSEWWWGADGSEFDEEEEAWEDWEIAEFERKWAENPDAKEVEIKLMPATDTTSKTDVVSDVSNETGMVSDVTSRQDVVYDDTRLAAPAEGRPSPSPPSPVKQDVEATL